MYLGEERNLGDPDRKRLRRKQRTYVAEWVEALAGVRPDAGGGRASARRPGRHLACCTPSPGSRPSLPRPTVETHLTPQLAHGPLELATTLGGACGRDRARRPGRPGATRRSSPTARPMLEQLRRARRAARPGPRPAAASKLRRAPPGPGQAHRPGAHRGAARPRLAVPRALAARRPGAASFTVGASVVTGIGVVHGVECVISPTTPRSGAARPTPTRSRRSFRAFDIAFANRLPMIQLVESGGADLPTQSEIFLPGGRSFRDLTRLSRRRHPHHRPRVRQLHRRRRLRARAVRPRRDGAAAAPRCSSAGRRW